MMDRPDYDAGDLVVCEPPTDTRLPLTGELVRGRVYRVSRLWFAFDYWRAWVDGASPHAVGWYAGSFRKVDPLPDALTSLLASTPREQVPA